MFDFERFTRHYGVAPATEGDRHFREGWVHIACPFCTGNPGHHLGWNTEDGYFYCFRCQPSGWHSVIDVVRALAGCSVGEAKRIVSSFRTTATVRDRQHVATERPRSLTLPTGTSQMADLHHRYLEGRGFDPDELERTWNLKGTGVVGEYAFRIVCPITFRGRVVSFDTRDVTGKREPRWKGCHLAQEIIPRKELLYGFDEAMKRGTSCVIVEGEPDVWRLGPGAVATFGIGFKAEQVNLVRQFERRVILFDPEPQAQRAAQSLGYWLEAFDGETEIIDTSDWDCDPGDLSPKDARDIMRELI